MEHLIFAAAVLLLSYGLLAGADGLYLHIWKYQLHERPESYKEHLAHTARALVFLPIVLLMYLQPPAGPTLWVAAGLIAVDLVLAVGDVLEEPGSRASLGGLSRGEYLIHVLASLAHASGLALILAAQPLSAWSDAAAAGPAYPALARFIAINVIPGSVLVALLHVWLCWRGRPRFGFERRRVAAMVPPPPAVGAP